MGRRGEIGGAEMERRWVVTVIVAGVCVWDWDCSREKRRSCSSHVLISQFSHDTRTLCDIYFSMVVGIPKFATNQQEEAYLGLG